MQQRHFSRVLHLVEQDTGMNAPALENSMLTYRSKQFLMLRPELVQICDCDAIEAFILRIVETKMQQGLEWVTLSYRQIKDALYRIVNNEKTVIAKLTNLLKRGFLKRRINPEKPHGAPQYRLDIATTQKALDALASVFDGGVPVDGTGISIQEDIPVPVDGTPRYQEMVPPVPVDGTGEYQQMVPIIDRDITDKITEEDRSLTSVSESRDAIATKQERGYPDQTLPFPDLECDAEERSIPVTNRTLLEQMLTSYPHPVDNEYHSYSAVVPVATRNAEGGSNDGHSTHHFVDLDRRDEHSGSTSAHQDIRLSGYQPEKQPTRHQEAAARDQRQVEQEQRTTPAAALQAFPGHTNPTIEQATMASSTLFPPTDRHLSPEAGASTQETRHRAKNKKVVEAKPAFQLTEQQQAFWLLWCDTWFNRDIPPELGETEYKHVRKLAPFIKTAEQLESLSTFARKELDQRGIKRKHIFLGNLVGSYAGWKQEQGRAQITPRFTPPPTIEELRAMPLY